MNVTRKQALLAAVVTGALFITSAYAEEAAPGAPKSLPGGLLEGYLPREALPNSLVLLPPPPPAGSPAFAVDEDFARKSVALRGTPRWTQATVDADLSFPKAAAIFSCALKAPITEQRTPHLYVLLRRSLTDAGLSTYAAKNHYQRQRPFLENKEPICTPADQEGIAKEGSYPSGHAAVGWAWALILSEIAPEQTDAILARGAAYGESRSVCNVHWHSDVVEGQAMAAGVVARLHAEPAFRADLEAAKSELAAIRADNVTLASDCAAEAAALAPPESVDTRIGTLSFEQGFPTEETTRKVFDEIDYQRAVQAYLWAYPAVSFESIRIGTKRDLGADLNDMVIADSFADPKGVWLTANDTTIYALANVDLEKSGPLVVDIPPGAIVGIIDDFWQRSLADVGLPGPDGAKGGKFLLLPPGYKGDAPRTGYHVLQGTMNNYNVMVRGIVQNDDKDAAVANVKQVKVYPLSESDNPKPNKFVSMSAKVMDTTPPKGMAFWERLSAFINNNPVQARDLFYMGMLKPLGIQKGKEFKPDARQKAILEDAARMGDAMGRVMLFEGPDRFHQVGEGLGTEPFPGSKWHWIFQVNPVQQTDAYGQIDERLHYTYGAIYTTPALGVMKAGPGGNYVQAFKDKDGNRLLGAKSYRLHVPANAPAEAFWSLTLYDTATRSMIQNPSNDSARSSLDKLKTNADGSIDLYFGPAGSAPAGLEANWIETVPGKGFYPMMRFYSPKAGLFDGTWKLPDVELVK